MHSYDDTHHTTSLTSPIQGTSVSKRTTYEDGLGRAVKSTISDASGVSYQTIETQYDPLGRAYKQSNPHNSTAQYWTQTNYDGVGRPVKTILQDGSSSTSVYTGPSITKTDPTGKQSKTQADGLGRVQSVYEPDVTNGNALTIQTTYAYSVLDQPATITEGSQTRTFNFDGMGRLTSQTLPESGTTSFQYNAFDKVTQRNDGNGVLTNYQYDSLNRMLGVSYTVPPGKGIAAMPNVCTPTGGTTANICIYYDEGGAAANALGSVTHRTDPSGTDTYTYDPHLPRVTQIQKTINGSNYTVGYQYNLANQVTALTYPSGRVVQQNYDAIGRTSSVVTGSTTLVSGFQYDPTFHATKLTYGSGIVQTMTFSPDRMQMTCLDYATQNSSGVCQTSQYSLFSLTYGYSQNGGNNGQITGITDGVQPGRSVTYSYDALGRLSQAVTTGSTAYPQWGLQWTYDRYGNPWSENSLYDSPPYYSISVDATTNRINTSGFAYDLAGNMTNDARNTLTYDGENRLVSSSGSLGSGSYTVRASGLRVMKSSGGTTTVYVFAGHLPIAEYVNGTLSTEYVYAGSRLIAEYR